ncbi:GAP family protein [Cellulosilyticum sp. ST5]|uniref:GAP family protein n=1 Tax=Cellulosilyticum sp. ST5 TaxID=3055805 RepID=UPI0039773E56
MSLVLILTTIITSAADSLNPVAITQQFVLQSLVKKPKHIWFFILATGVTNFTGGLMVYYGLVAIVSTLFTTVLLTHQQNLLILELIAGIMMLILACYVVLDQRIKCAIYKGQLQNEDNQEMKDQQIIAEKIKSVSPIALIVLGVLATITELATALPYFAFLAVLLNYKLKFLQVISILLLYNFIYSSPLMMLYFIYRKKQVLFDKLYKLIKKKVTKWASVIIPTLFIITGIVLLFHSIRMLLR